MFTSDSGLCCTRLSQRWGSPLRLILHCHYQSILNEVLSLWARWLLVSSDPAKNENLGWAKLVAKIVQTRSTTDFFCGKCFRKRPLQRTRIRKDNNKIRPANFQLVKSARSRIPVLWDVTQRRSDPERLEVMKDLVTLPV